jgi:hypothetical protein
LSTIYAPMGTYPSFAFAPADDAVIIWAAGGIWRVPLRRNADGEKAAHGPPERIEFTAHIEKRLAETRSDTTDVLALETADTMRAHAFDDLRADERGQRVLFHSAGRTYVHAVRGGRGGTATPQELPRLHADKAYYAPAFVPGSAALVLHARWDDAAFSTFELADLESGRSWELAGLPRGRYRAPALCTCAGSRRTLAFARTAGDVLTGAVVATAHPGIYLADVDLAPALAGHSGNATLALTNVRFLTADADPADDKLRLRFADGAATLVVEGASAAFTLDLARGPDALGRLARTDLAAGRAATQVALSAARGAHALAAFVDYRHVYVAPAPRKDADERLWSKPGNATRGLARLSLHGGHDLAWSGDGKRLFWFLGRSPFPSREDVRPDRRTQGPICTASRCPSSPAASPRLRTTRRRSAPAARPRGSTLSSSSRSTAPTSRASSTTRAARRCCARHLERDAPDHAHRHARGPHPRRRPRPPRRRDRGRVWWGRGTRRARCGPARRGDH